MEYIHVNLARKLGGVCDIDQIYILNSVDGPTTGQCGPLSGYTSKLISKAHLSIFQLVFISCTFPATVAVNPKQDKPLKIALLIQNDGMYNWEIKMTQLTCSEINNFKGIIV